MTQVRNHMVAACQFEGASVQRISPQERESRSLLQQ